MKYTKNPISTKLHAAFFKASFNETFQKRYEKNNKDAWMKTLLTSLNKVFSCSSKYAVNNIHDVSS